MNFNIIHSQEIVQAAQLTQSQPIDTTDWLQYVGIGTLIITAWQFLRMRGKEQEERRQQEENLSVWRARQEEQQRHIFYRLSRLEEGFVYRLMPPKED